MNNWYIVQGVNPLPWTAPSFAVTGKRVQAYKSEELRAYQAAVSDMFQEQNPTVKLQPGDLAIEFFLWRQLELEEITDARNIRRHVADATNMQKALEDALQGVLYENDRSVKDIRTWIVEQGPDVEPCILIHVGRPPDSQRPALTALRQRITPSVAQTPDNIHDRKVIDIF